MCNQRRGDARRRQAESLGRQLLPTIEEYVRWHRLHEAYRAGHPDPDGKVLLCLADGCGKAAQRLLDAAAELDATEPAGCSSRGPRD